MRKNSGRIGSCRRLSAQISVFDSYTIQPAGNRRKIQFFDQKSHRSKKQKLFGASTQNNAQYQFYSENSLITGVFCPFFGRKNEPNLNIWGEEIRVKKGEEEEIGVKKGAKTAHRTLGAISKSLGAQANKMTKKIVCPVGHH
uniref:Uncharacterized protein n=1 Tax=Romanomermis culicivorax TaxID=13658 RepID=A0A915IQB0_ROMCU